MIPKQKNRKQNYSSSLFARINVVPTSGKSIRFSKSGGATTISFNCRTAEKGRPVEPIIQAFYPFPHIAWEDEIDAFAVGQHYSYFQSKWPRGAV